MVEGGTGGANTNKNGLAFEKRTALAQALAKHGFDVREDGSVLSPDGEAYCTLAPKHALQSRILRPRGVEMKDVISKQLLPDEAAFFESDDRCKLVVLEKKFQNTEGSTDEKIQTGPFKLSQYKKIASALSENIGKPVSVSYSYVLSDWFRQPKYRDELDYNRENGIDMFFGEVPISTLG